MKLATLGFGLILTLPWSAQAETALPSGSATEANKKVVTAFYEMAFNQHRPTEAAKKYFGDRYIQHNPHVPNGATAFYEYFEGFYKKHPEARARIIRVIAEGNWVALHVHSTLDQRDLGRAVVDIFRLENGKIVEHFDVVQAVSANTANGNTQFEGSKAD